VAKQVKQNRVGAVKSRVQVKNPVTDRWVKVDTNTGRIIDHKKTPGPYKGVRKKY
jgi:glutamate dehydrogenase/leucine dehydrogenase